MKLQGRGRVLGLLLTLPALAGLLLYVALQSGPMAPVRVTTVAAEVRAIRPQIAGIGNVEARYVHRIGPLSAGRLLRVEVQPGDRVAAGQLLAELDPVDLEHRLAALDAATQRAQAAVAELQAREVLAASQAARYEKLFGSGAVSEDAITTRRQELQIAQAALEAGRQELGRAHAERRALARQRDQLSLRSPVDGLVAARLADPGTTVVAGQAVLEVIEPEQVWIHARFDQVSAHGLAAGLAASVELRSREGEPLPARVARVEPKADALTEETVAKLSLSSRPDPLPPLGELAHLTVDLPALEATLSLPSAALRRVGQQTGVWRVRDGAIAFAPLRTGLSDLHGQVQVLEGLQAGDRVVLYSASRLTASSRIREVESLAGALP
jgi:RND family efflux transporter MFP subunit